MKNIKFIDVIIFLAVIAALGVGYMTYKHFRQTADKQVEATAKIAFQVYLRGVTITGTENPIKNGEDTFISIRNVPYTNLKVIDTKIDTKKMIVPVPSAKQPFMLVNDYSQMFMYDIIVTVQDTAKITKDGPVVGGNKIKIGLPITLEGKYYKFNGTVSNVQILQSTPVAQPATQTQAPVQPGSQPQTQAPAQSGAQPSAQQPSAGAPQAQTPSAQPQAKK